ncbi:MAG TPA: GDP-mannose 4,6-dehydratase [Verrucomicrobiota bacterium]|nr:GDP-mannose 4,6-dehydratase [Verrucomicrobiota bacterium]HNU51041.1 GDP-mannose 4,6-dehydratase [Verrucomicrobiota bacterium]
MIGHSPSPILVTGGAGFIGSHLTERLVGAGRPVVVIDDFSTGSRENLAAVAGHPALRVLEHPVSGCPGLRELVAGCAGVVHLAAAVGVDLVVRSPIRTIQTNLDETEAILGAASASQTPVLIASTSEVYGKSQQPEFREDDDLLIGPPHLGRWSYACSKLTDEFLALAYMRERGLPVAVVRVFNTVGPRQTGRYGMVLPRFIESARRHEPLRVFGDGTQTRCFCYVGDTVEAILRLLSAPWAAGQVFNVGSTEEISILDLARLVITTLESRSTIELVPYDQAYAPGFEDMRRRRPSIEKLHRLTGFRPATTLREIILRTAGAGGCRMDL